MEETNEANGGCRGGAVDRSSLGPFGLLVIADETLSELTPIYFRPTNRSDGGLVTYFCADERRYACFLDSSLLAYSLIVQFLVVLFLGKIVHLTTFNKLVTANSNAQLIISNVK